MILCCKVHPTVNATNVEVVGFYALLSLVESQGECVSVHAHDAPDTRLVHYTSNELCSGQY